MSDNLADEFGILREQKNNRIYGNAANQVLRSSSDDIANIRIFFEYFLLFFPEAFIRPACSSPKSSLHSRGTRLQDADPSCPDPFCSTP